LGRHRTGAVDGQRFFALGLAENSEFRLVYPAGESLQRIDPPNVRTYLVRRSFTPSVLSAPADTILPANEVELSGTMQIRFRDNSHFKLGVDLKDTGTNGVALKGTFLAYDQKEFEPMTYVAAFAMLSGVGEGKPVEVKPKEGDLRLVQRSIATLSRQPNPGASFDACIIEANRCVTFTKRTALKNPVGIQLSIAANSIYESELKAKMESVCREMGLRMTDNPSFALNDLTTPMEPHFLSVEVRGRPSDVSEKLAILLQRIFAVTELTRFKVAE
jgi:hypothetical protein